MVGIHSAQLTEETEVQERELVGISSFIRFLRWVSLVEREERMEFVLRPLSEILLLPSAGGRRTAWNKNCSQRGPKSIRSRPVR